MNNHKLRTSDGRNAFQYFNVPDNCEDDKIIKAKFRKRALAVHPDKNPHRFEWANKEFKLANNFFHMIENGNQRIIYRDHLEKETEYVDDGSEGRDVNDGEYDDDINDIMSMYRNGTLFDEFTEDAEFNQWFEKEPILCCQTCKKLAQKDNDRLLICELCEIMSHQKCHDPPILSMDLNLEWICNKCRQRNDHLRSLPIDGGSNEKENYIKDENHLQGTLVFNPLLHSTPNSPTNLDSTNNDTFLDALSSNINVNENDDIPLSNATSANETAMSANTSVRIMWFANQMAHDVNAHQPPPLVKHEDTNINVNENDDIPLSNATSANETAMSANTSVRIMGFANQMANDDNAHQPPPLVNHEDNNDRRRSSRLIAKNMNKPENKNRKNSVTIKHESGPSPEDNHRRHRLTSNRKRKLYATKRLEPRSKKLKPRSKRFTKPGKPIHYWEIKAIKDHVIATKAKTLPNLYFGNQVYFLVEWKENDSQMVWYNDSLVADHNINADGLVDAYVNSIRCKKSVPCKKLTCKCNHCSKCGYCELTKINYAGPNKISQHIATFDLQRKFNNAQTLKLRGKKLTRKQLSSKPIMARKKIDKIRGKDGFRSIHQIKYQVVPNYSERISLVSGQPISLKMFQPKVFTEADIMYSADGNITNCAQTVFQHLFNDKINTKNVPITSSNLRKIFETYSNKILFECRSFDPLWTKTKRKVLHQRGIVKGETKQYITSDSILQKKNGVYVLEVSTPGSKNVGHHLIVLNCFNRYIYEGGKLAYLFTPSETESELGRRKILMDLKISKIFKVWLVCEKTYAAKSQFDVSCPEFYHEISGSKDSIGHPIFKV